MVVVSLFKVQRLLQSSSDVMYTIPVVGLVKSSIPLMILLVKADDASSLITMYLDKAWKQSVQASFFINPFVKGTSTIQYTQEDYSQQPIQEYSIKFFH